MVSKLFNYIASAFYSKKEHMKKGFFRRALDKNDASVALSSIIVLLLMLIGILLLIVPMFILIIEAWYNHTINTDLNGMAAYIAAVTAIFATAGSIKVGIHWSDGKTERAKMEHEIMNDECDARPPLNEVSGD